WRTGRAAWRAGPVFLLTSGFWLLTSCLVPGRLDLGRLDESAIHTAINRVGDAEGEDVDGSAAEYGSQGVLCFGPNGVGGAPILAGTADVAIQADVEVDRTFDGFHHLEQGGAAVAFLEFETP